MNDIIYVLRIEEDGQSHYVYIKNIDRLLNTHKNTYDTGKRVCPICQQKVKLCNYGSHMQECYKFAKGSTIIELPEEGAVMKFKNHKNQLEHPFIFTWDSEATNLRVKYGKLKERKQNKYLFTWRTVVVI